jgi:hypothetical protein
MDVERTIDEIEGGNPIPLRGIALEHQIAESAAGVPTGEQIKQTKILAERSPSI